MEEPHPEPTFFGPLLVARDFELTVSFYRTVLGLPVTGSAPYAKCVSKSSTFSIVEAGWWARVNASDRPPQSEAPLSNTVLAVQVADLDETFERLSVTGTRFLSPPAPREPMGVRNAFLRDPDGRIVMLTGPLLT
ncbi:MAG: VOC family protein [Thermoplasmata archaeon]|nr:VOC family protein [Thermoplasmata archaeon]